MVHKQTLYWMLAKIRFIKYKVVNCNRLDFS